MSWKVASLTRSALPLGSTTASSPLTTAQPFFAFGSRSRQPFSVAPSNSFVVFQGAEVLKDGSAGAFFPSKRCTLPFAYVTCPFSSPPSSLASNTSCLPSPAARMILSTPSTTSTLFTGAKLPDRHTRPPDRPAAVLSIWMPPLTKVSVASVMITFHRPT